MPHSFYIGGKDAALWRARSTDRARMTSPSPLRLLRLREVIHRCGLGKTAIYTRIRAGELPQPVPLGGVVAWVETEVDAWIEARIAERGLHQ